MLLIHRLLPPRPRKSHPPIFFSPRNMFIRFEDQIDKEKFSKADYATLPILLPKKSRYFCNIIERFTGTDKFMA